MPGPPFSCPRCWRCYREVNRRASFSRPPGWSGSLLMSAAKSLLTISPMSEPWRLMLTASGRLGPLKRWWLPFHSTTCHRALRRLWTLVLGLRPKHPHRPLPVRPGCLVASVALSVSTIASGAWLPATVGIPAPGKIRGREMCRPPVGYRAAVRRR